MMSYLCRVAGKGTSAGAQRDRTKDRAVMRAEKIETKKDIEGGVSGTVRSVHHSDPSIPRAGRMLLLSTRRNYLSMTTRPPLEKQCRRMLRNVRRVCSKHAITQAAAPPHRTPSGSARRDIM